MDIYQEYAVVSDPNGLQTFAQNFLKNNLPQNNFTDAQISYLWKIVNDFIEDIYEKYTPEPATEHVNLLSKLTTECKEIFQEVKNLFFKDASDFDINAHTKELYKRMTEEILKANLNCANTDLKNKCPGKILASPADDVFFYSLRLNQYLYSLGICDEQNLINCNGEAFEIIQETRDEDQQKKVLATLVDEVDSYKEIPLFILEAFESPMCSKEEKVLEKLIAVDVFVNQLKDELEGKTPDILILKAAYFSFCQIHELKCHIHITKCEALLKELEAYKD